MKIGNFSLLFLLLLFTKAYSFGASFTSLPTSCSSKGEIVVSDCESIGGGVTSTIGQTQEGRNSVHFDNSKSKLGVPALKRLNRSNLSTSTLKDGVCENSHDTLSKSTSLSFEQNIGQYNDQVLFKTNDAQATHFFLDNEIRTVVGGKRNLAAKEAAIENYAYALEFVGGNARDIVPLMGLDKNGNLRGKRNYITSEGSFNDAPQFGQLLYRNVWQGINAKFYESDGHLKYDFLVAAGQDPAQVRLLLKGGKDLKVNAAGELEFTTALGTLQKGVPYTYQVIDGKKVEVLAKYQISGDTISFALGQYDSSEPLVIDPIALKYATFLGGSGDDVPQDIYVTDSYIYITGYTSSTDFPTTIGASLDGSKDVFVTCLEKNGSAIVWSTLIGGSGSETGFAIAVDENTNHVFVSGYTNSTDFPVNGVGASAYDSNGGNSFLVRLSADGTQLRYGTYYDQGDVFEKRKMVLNSNTAYFIASGDNSKIVGINTAVSGSAGLIMEAGLPTSTAIPNFTELEQDKDGNLWVVGWASTDVADNFPTTANAVQKTGDFDIDNQRGNFVAKFSLTGDVLYTSWVNPIWSPGNAGGTQFVPSLDVDAQGNVYVGAGHLIYDAPSNLTIFSGVQQFHELSQLSSMDYFGYTELMTITKIPYDLSPVYEFVSILPAQSANNFSDPEIAVDKKGKIHIYNQASNAFGENFYFPYTSGAISTANRGANTSSGANYYVIDPSGSSVLYGTTVTESNSYTYWGLFVDDDCTAYMLSDASVSTGYPITPTYRDVATNSQVAVVQPSSAGNNDVHLTVFHDVLPSNNTIDDFQVGNNTFCIGGLIYQNPNDGPILGNGLNWQSGDGSTASHNLPDIDWGNGTRPHPNPANPTYQWQISRDNGVNWTDIPGENLAVLKPSAESIAGTVQYRRNVVSYCCDTLSSNVATATIAGAFNLQINTSGNTVYYCEGSTQDLGITISDASGNISWQWYNGFSPLTNAEVNPASGSGVAEGAFTAQIPPTQNQNGFYRLVVTDAGGCKKEATITFARLTASAGTGATMAICPGTIPSTTLGPSVANSNFDYNWTGPSGFTSAQANPTVTVAGDYFLQVKLKTDLSFCAAGETSVTVLPNSAFDASLTNLTDDFFCQSDNPAAIGLSGTPPAGYVFQWSPGNNLNNQQAFNPIFNPGVLPNGVAPVDETAYTFAALRLSDGCVFETTKKVSVTALALASAGDDRASCGSNSAVLGQVETSGLYWQWQAISTTYPSGLAALVAEPNFLIDGVNTNLGTNKFANVTAPSDAGCYDIYYELQASYEPFPNTCYTVDTVRFSVCPAGICNPCPIISSNYEGSGGYCGGVDAVITATGIDGINFEWTTYSIDGVVQPVGTAPRGLFNNNNGIQGTSLSATGPHSGDVVANFDDPSWGWSGANVVVYQLVATGTIDENNGACSSLLQVFSASQSTTLVVDIFDKALCNFPSPGTQVGSEDTAPYTISGIDYGTAPNSGLNWAWTELKDGSTTSITAGANTPFPTLNPTETTDYLIVIQDPATGCLAQDTTTLTIVSILANAGSDITGTCDGTLVQLGSSSMNSATFNYSWSPASGLNFPIGTPNSNTARPYLTVSNAPSGITYSVTVTDPVTGCEATDDIVITTNADPPTAITNQSDIACPGGSKSAFFGSPDPGATYSVSVVSGGASLSWVTSPTSNSTDRRVYVTIPDGTPAGTYVYQVTKTKGNCGSVTANYTITVHSAPTLTLATSPPACTTPFTAITASPSVRWGSDAAYLYTTSAGTTNINGGFSSYYGTVYISPTNFERTLTALTSASCGASITIPASNNDEVSAGSDQGYCEGDSPIQLGVANTGTSHSWAAVGYSSSLTDNPATPTAGEATTMLSYLSSTTSNTPTFSQGSHTPGIYVYELTSTFASGCSVSAEVTITVAEAAGDLVGAGQQTCSGEAVTLGVTTPPSGYTYQWTALNPATEGYTITNPNSTNPVVRPVVTTTYRLIATNGASSCQSEQTVVVSVTDRPNIADVDMATQCAPTGAVDLTAQIPSYGTYFNQVWYRNSVPNVIVTTPTAVTPSQTTNYYLVAENTEGCADTAIVTINLENPQTPIIALGANTTCPSNTIDLADFQGTPSNPSYTLEWHSDNTTNPATLLASTLVGNGTYYLFETTPAGCESASDNIVLTSLCPEICTDLIDNDGDGEIDCEDDDCPKANPVVRVSN